MQFHTYSSVSATTFCQFSVYCTAATPVAFASMIRIIMHVYDRNYNYKECGNLVVAEKFSTTTTTTCKVVLCLSGKVNRITKTLKFLYERGKYEEDRVWAVVIHRWLSTFNNIEAKSSQVEKFY